MQSSHSQNTDKITSFEIAQYMIATQKSLSAKELSLILAKIHPNLKVDAREVYTRLRTIAKSPYSVVYVQDDTRPRKFKIVSLNAEFYRRTRGPRRFDATLINELKMTYDDKEKRECLHYQASRKEFDAISRRNRTRKP